ncbi:papa-1-like conserved region protein [Grosmannia clavigera kw1407]|uniref:Papa-1-like conserved region protein n=1 Tax=Grosmannia clavigera (strain kw1407 / UAMH 11150) TaxID=655863 RepID=F0X6I7_GROCL|nr:papa-1-like conserved region protein [Grosmannia clavigera kw1407]EFX06587.1 papa-1-like conserved region protein [Grosmannia clavigera kw1407]
MSTRPRRSAAQRASMAITDMADRDSAMTSRYRRLGEGRGSGRAPSADSNMSSVLASGSRKRQSGAASSLREQSVSDGVVHSRRPTRGVARGGAVPPPSIKVSKPAGEGASVVTAPRGVGRPPGSGNKLRAPLTSKPGPKSKVRRDGEGGSREGTPDLSKMTRRQRARFEETPQEYMKLSDEVQVKKHFTAEELSMRRAEMARRRRNLSEKRNEEVKAETINKLLKRQAPKTTKKNALAGDDSGDEDGRPRPDPTIIRWVSNSKGSRVAVAAELLAGPVGSVFRTLGSAMPPRKVQLVEEVA